MRKLIAIGLTVFIFLTLNGFIGPYKYEFTEREDELLMLISDAEAGNQGVKGQALIMRVVLNRWLSGDYGPDIESVIFADGQFYTPGMPREPSDKARIALNMVKHGWDESQGALYFCATGYNGDVPLFKYRGHYFSRKEPIDERCERTSGWVYEEVS